MSKNDIYILGLDLDGVTSDYTNGLRDFVARDRGMSTSEIPDPVNYSFADCDWPFVDMDDYKETHNRAVQAGLFRYLQPMPGVAEAIKQLRHEGVHVRVVTHRLLNNGTYAVVVTDTIQWLDLHGVEIDSICFSGLKDSIGASAYVDDSPSNVVSIREAGTPVFVFDHLYNRHLEGPRINNWAEGVKQILSHKKSLGL